MLKHVALITVSDVALLSELRDVRPVIAAQTFDIDIPSALTPSERHVLGPLLWVFEFFMRFFTGQNPARARMEVFETNPELYRPYPPNRKARRFWKRYPTYRHVPVSKRSNMYRLLFPRNISWARFKEMRSREGNWGRVIDMGFRRQKFTKFELRPQMGASFRAVTCGGFKPASASTSDGLWAVQLPPN